MLINRKWATIKIIGWSDLLTENLVKILVLNADSTLKIDFKSEAKDYVCRLSNLRLKPNDQPGSRKFYYKRLFNDAFGGSEMNAIEEVIRFVGRRYAIRTDINEYDVLRKIKQFYLELSNRLSLGLESEYLVDEIENRVFRF